MHGVLRMNGELGLLVKEDKMQVLKYGMLVLNTQPERTALSVALCDCHILQLFRVCRTEAGIRMLEAAPVRLTSVEGAKSLMGLFSIALDEIRTPAVSFPPSAPRIAVGGLLGQGLSGTVFRAHD